MYALFPVLIASQLSNIFPLFAFLVYSDTDKFSDYLFVILLGQLIWPLLTLRLDIQIQIELYKQRRDYILYLTLWVFFVLSAIAALTLYCLLGNPIKNAVLNPFWGALIMGIALGITGVMRGYLVSIGAKKGLLLFEGGNIAKNILAFALAAWMVDTADIKQAFVWTNITYGILIMAIMFAVLGARPRTRILLNFLDFEGARSVMIRSRTRKVLLFSFPNSFIGMVTGRLPLIAVEAMLSAPLSAAFLAANRLTLSPINFLIFAFRVVTVIEINKRRRNEANVFKKIVFLIIVLSPLILTPMLLPLYDSGLLRHLFSYFDPSWLDALEFLPMTYPWAVLFMMTGWLDRIFDITGQQYLVLLIEITMLLVAISISGLIAMGVLSGMAALLTIILLGILHCLAWAGLFFSTA